jgi:DNA-binding IclR family transcriptional regulator|tara:strand:+ start:5502 stop:6236 length:735 start_codon:yes stop_codon:yes gene_type:complete
MRLFYILDVMAKQQSSLTPSEINQHLNWPKQTVHRLCKSMVEEGFLHYDASGKRLLPSASLRTLANGLLASDWHASARHQILEKLSSKVKETVNFVIPEQPGMIYRDRVQTNWAFQIHLPVGTHVPFYCTASGKTYLASLTPKNRRTMVESLHLKNLTINTVDSIEPLMQELALVQKQGFALDNEEFYEGMIAIAAPVLDPKGRYHGAVAMHGPTVRLDINTLKNNYGDLRSAADQLSQLIFSV